MTREHRVIMSLEEVQQVRWRCAICRATVTYPIHRGIRLPKQCPACGNEGSSDVEAKVKAEQLQLDFIDNMRALIAAQGKPYSLPGVLELECRDDAPRVQTSARDSRE